MLARDLGKTVGELTDPETGIDLDEFFRWKALYQVERHEREHAAKVQEARARRRGR